MPDRLASLLTQFHLHCQVLDAGNTCATGSLNRPGESGHLHLLRRGALLWSAGDGELQRIDEPALLFFGRPVAHRLEPEPGAELVCASVDFGARFGNPLLQGLPSPWVLRLEELPELSGLLTLFFDEAFAGRCGRAEVLNRLAELLVIQLLRIGFHQGVLQAGPLAGLGDARLAKALTALHNEPAAPWTLERLADQAGMSRARFAAHFTAVVGHPPGDYLTGLRIGLAQRLLSRGQPLKAVAGAVGYGSPNALSRAFTQRVGRSPMAWLAGA